jgi:hypothetical protein
LINKHGKKVYVGGGRGIGVEFGKGVCRGWERDRGQVWSFNMNIFEFMQHQFV